MATPTTRHSKGGTNGGFELPCWVGDMIYCFLESKLAAI